MNECPLTLVHMPCKSQGTTLCGEEFGYCGFNFGGFRPQNPNFDKCFQNLAIPAKFSKDRSRGLPLQSENWTVSNRNTGFPGNTQQHAGQNVGL